MEDGIQLDADIFNQQHAAVITESSAAALSAAYAEIARWRTYSIMLEQKLREEQEVTSADD